MEFHEHPTPYPLPTYHKTHFTVGDVVFRQPICVNRTNIVPIELNHWQNLTVTDFQAAIDARADLILIGTGQQQQFMDWHMVAQLSAQGIGVECMNSAAVCRTLLLLQEEPRHIWAWLFL